MLNQFQQIELFNNESNKSKDIETLGKIFTHREYDDMCLYLLNTHKGLFEENEGIELIAAINRKDISIYKYTFNRPDEPDPDSQIIDILKEWGKCSSEQTVLLYWWVYNLCRNNGKQLVPGHDKYLKIEGIDRLLVRCGEIRGDDIYNEVLNGAEQFIICPFICTRKKELYRDIEEVECYLVRFEKHYISYIEEKKAKIQNELYKKLIQNKKVKK